MKRRIVPARNSPAIGPRRPSVRYLTKGEVTKRFRRLAEQIARQFDETFRDLAK